MICLKFELIFPAVQNFYKNFLTRGGGVFIFQVREEGGIKEVRQMELKELVLEVEVLEEKIAPTSVSGGRG